MMQSSEIPIKTLISDYPLFTLALPFRCRCGATHPWTEHVAAIEERHVSVKVKQACQCGAEAPALAMPLSRLQRRRLETLKDSPHIL